MSRIFGKYRFVFVILALVGSILLVATCSRDEGSLPDQARRIATGNVWDEAYDFHPDNAKALVVRQVAPHGGPVTDPGQVLDRIILELDYHDPDAPRYREIEALKGGDYPSYAGARGIVALDAAGALVFLEDGSDKAEPVNLPDVPSRPTKPVASPDGKQIAFLAIATPPKSDGKKLILDNPELFRYQGYVAPTDGGTARKLTVPPDDKHMLVALRWDGADYLYASWMVQDPRLPMTRLSRIRVSDGAHELVYFGDLPPALSFSEDARFFIYPDTKEPAISFASRAMEHVERLPLGGAVKAALLRPDGRLALVSALSDNAQAVHLWVVPTPANMLALPAVE